MVVNALMMGLDGVDIGRRKNASKSQWSHVMMK